MRVIEEAERRMDAFAAHCRAFEREYPGVKVWAWNDAEISGLEFPNGGALPSGWRFSVKRGYAVPDVRSKEGRIHKQRMKSVVGLDALKFTSMLSAALRDDYGCHIASRIMWTVFERYGEVAVLSVPLACKAVPPGCVELKMSEYWKLREDGEARRAK